VTIFTELRALAGAVDAEPELAWRLTRIARSAEYDLGGTAVDAFARLVRSEPEVVKLLKQVDTAYEVIIRGGNREYALATMLEATEDWEKLKTGLRSGAALTAPRRVADVIDAMDDHFGARLNHALDSIAEVPLGSSARKLMVTAATPAGKAGKELLKEVEKALKGATKAEKQAVEKLCRYLSADDPAWSSIAELIAGQPGASKADLLRAVEGKLGEHLAMRSPSVWAFFERAYKKSLALTKTKNFAGWRFRLVDAPVHAPTSHGLGEIYDSSAWLIRRGADGEMEAMPLMLLQVKAGTSREAIDQISRDVQREFGGFIELADANGRIVRHRIVPPDGFEVHRVLVAPRPPSPARITGRTDTGLALKPGIAVDYAKAPLTKDEIVLATDIVTASGLRWRKRP
jgi:hypothetical protein